jgi:uncharacterized membrane protein
MTSLRALVALVMTCSAAACGGDAAAPDAGPPDAEINNGCEALRAPQAEPGDPIDGDTYATFAGGFFAQHCTRCHSSTLTGGERNGAPAGYDWDVEATVRDHLAEIRNAVGVLNYMPFAPPDPTCAERQRIVRWIDADAP